MNDNYQRSGGMSPWFAAILGAAAGAIAVALSSKETREMLKGKMEEAKQKGTDQAEELRLRAREAREVGREKLVEGLEEAKSRVENMEPKMDSGDKRTAKH